MKKVGFVGRWSPLDKLAWSGTYHYTYQAIQKHFDVDIFHFKWNYWVREYLLLQKQIQKLYNKKLAVEFLKTYAHHFSKHLENALKLQKPDVLFVPAASQLIAYCNTSIPIVYMADATFFQLQGYYDSFQNLPKYNIDQGIAFDKLAFEKATHCMLASQWTKESAIKDYGISEHKISMVPLGANMDLSQVQYKEKEDPTICRLLFLGVEWERKGGEIVLSTFQLLKKQGIPVRLKIIGCQPPHIINDENIEVIPFLNKQIQHDLEKLNDVLEESTFLFLPSRAECAGIVFCEASAYGLPSISTHTGGIATYVENGVNGFLLPLGATAEAYATLINEKFNDKILYKKLRASARKLYESKLNWDHWGTAFKKIVDEIV